METQQNHQDCVQSRWSWAGLNQRLLVLVLLVEADELLMRKQASMAPLGSAHHCPIAGHRARLKCRRPDRMQSPARGRLGQSWAVGMLAQDSQQGALAMGRVWYPRPCRETEQEERTAEGLRDEPNQSYLRRTPRLLQQRTQPTLLRTGLMAEERQRPAAPSAPDRQTQPSCYVSHAVQREAIREQHRMPTVAMCET